MKTPSSSFVETIEREKNKFFRYVRKRLSRIPAMDVEDIVADMVHGLLKRADIFGEIENLTAYAYRSLENRIVDFRRNSRPTESLDDEEKADSLIFGLPTSADNPEQSLERLQLQDRMLWAIGQLSPKERAIWIATEIDGHGFRELAEEWDEPLGTLLSRKSRANARLRELLKDFTPN
ncbi:MAG: RNA polymerase sigma factor [Acidobacteriota bacterium]